MFSYIKHSIKRRKAMHIADLCNPIYRTWKNGYTQSLIAWVLKEEVKDWLLQNNIQYEFIFWSRKRRDSAPILVIDNLNEKMLFKLTWV